GSDAAEVANPDTASMTVADAVANSLLAVDSLNTVMAGTPVDSTAPPAPSAPRYNTSEDPEFAARNGWPVRGPTPLPGSLLPDKRIVCYYGNPNSTRMGALGEFPKDEMLSRLQRQIAAWEQADPATPVMPCLHMVSV